MSGSDILAMPCAEAAEKSVLSWMFKEPEKFFPMALSQGVGVDHFWKLRDFAAMLFDRRRKGQSLEFITLCEEEHHSGRLKDVGGPSLAQDVYGYGTAGGGYWTEHVQLLRERHAERIAIKQGIALKECGGADAAQRISEEACEEIKQALIGPRTSVDGEQAACEFADYFKELVNKGDIPGSSTGIQQLDDISGGMRSGELWVVCGRPSRGKSVLMLQLAARAMQDDLVVAIFSLEMTINKVVGRIVSYLGRIEYENITHPHAVSTRLNGEAFINKQLGKRVSDQLRRIEKSKLWIEDRGGQSLDSITAEATRIRDMEGRIDLVVVDYLQLTSGDRQRNEARHEEVARVSGGLKQLAKTLDCPVLTGSQLNDDGRVRESRAIEQDADALLYIVEDGIKIAKMRDGRRDEVLPLRLNGQMQCFE